MAEPIELDLLLLAVSTGELGTGVVADWLEEHGDPRAEYARNLGKLVAKMLAAGMSMPAVDEMLAKMPMTVACGDDGAEDAGPPFSVDYPASFAPWAMGGTSAVAPITMTFGD